MKILILFLSTTMFAQFMPSPDTQPLDTTSKYILTVPQEQAMKNWKAVAENAMKKRNHELFSKAHHEWFLACREAVKADGFPVTAFCDYQRNVIRGKDAK